MIDCWNLFDEQFTLAQAQATPQHFADLYADKLKASTNDPSVVTLLSIAHEYSLPRDLESQGWSTDPGTSHHLTSHDSFILRKLIQVLVMLVLLMANPSQ